MSNTTSIDTTNVNKPNTKRQRPGLGMRAAVLAHGLNLLEQAGHTVTTQTTGTEVTITIAGMTLGTDDRGLTQFVAVE